MTQPCDDAGTRADADPDPNSGETRFRTRLFDTERGPQTADQIARWTRPLLRQRPWVMTNMVASIDGATVLDGRSGALSSRSDRDMFAALRRCADGVIVGAGTVNAERYRPDDRLLIAVVSGSLAVDPGVPLFAAPTPGAERQAVEPTDAQSTEHDEARPTEHAAAQPTLRLPIVFTSRRASAQGRRSLAGRAEVITLGDAEVDLGRALEQMRCRGAHVVICEGGPELLGAMAAADLIDEINLTISPALVVGESPRMTSSQHAASFAVRRGFAPASVAVAEEMLFLRWTRADCGP